MKETMMSLRMAGFGGKIASSEITPKEAFLAGVIF